MKPYVAAKSRPGAPGEPCVAGALALASLVNVLAPGRLPALTVVVLVLTLILQARRSLSPMAAVLASLGVACSGLAFVTDPQHAWTHVSRVASLAGLICAVLLVGAALAQTRMVALSGTGLFKGAPRPRYLGLSFGAALLSLPLNFGSTSLLATIVGERRREVGDRPELRNALLAVIRGFGSAPFWSPLSISIAATLTFLPQVDGTLLVSVMAPVAVLYVLTGLGFREPEAGAARRDPPTGMEISALVRVGLSVGVLAGGVLAVHAGTGVGFPGAVVLASAAALILLAVADGAADVARVAGEALSVAGNELAIVAGSVAIGSVLAAQVAGWTLVPGQLAWPLLALGAAVVPSIFFLAGVCGVNPIVTGSLVGGTLAPAWPGEAQIVLAAVMVTGWGLTAGGTPYTAGVVLAGRMSGYPARRLALVWAWPMNAVWLAVTGVAGAIATSLVLA